MAKKKRPLIIGNWKMYKTREETIRFVEKLLPLVEDLAVDVGLAVPFTSLSEASRIEGSLLIGAQNMNDADEGAFTGEIAGKMLVDAGASFVILGHSERRHLFHEDHPMIKKKVLRAFEVGLRPILCIGETEVEREKGHEAVLEEQLFSALDGVKDPGSLVIAYEPVWAIGTGKTATPAMVEETHAHIRSLLQSLFGKIKGKKVPILYGGSVKPDNIQALMKKKEIQGALVGGASLKVETFIEIIKGSIT